MKNRVGEKHITKEGYEIEIIEYISAINCTIQFDNRVIIKNIQYGHIKNGVIKNLYHKSVCGVGYLGVGKYSNKTHPKIYTTWNNMFKRCYDLKLQEKRPTYKGCFIIEEWQSFQNFAKWYGENFREGFDLDKDILVKGNKIYSPETCAFVPREINSLLTKHEAKRGKYPIGVCKVGGKFQALININGKRVNLGYFYIPKEAFLAYKTAKEKQIKEVAEKHKNQITKPTYKALINYQVEITD